MILGRGRTRLLVDQELLFWNHHVYLLLLYNARSDFIFFMKINVVFLSNANVLEVISHVLSINVISFIIYYHFDLCVHDSIMSTW